ncbi:987_t:CDS:2, partial [Cetraspora pellucida]
GPKPDYKRARNWERERVYGSIYLHQPTFVDGNLSGTVNNGTIGTVNGIVSGSSKREVQVPDNQDNDKVPKQTRNDDYFPNLYDMRFYEDININEDIYIDEIHLSQETTNAPANIMNVSNILNDPEIEKSITSMSPSPYYKQPQFITNNEYIDIKEKKAKIKSSLNYGIINLNDSRIMNILGPSVKVYFEAEMKKYKLQRSVSKEALETL